MKFNELSHMMQKPEPKPDTYEAGMALNQLLKIGTHAIKIHNMIDDDAEMEAWVAKKIDLAGDYVKKVHGYMQGEKAGLYDDGGLTEDAGNEAMAKEIAKVYDNVVAYIQDDSDNEPDDQGGLRSGYDDEDLTDAQDLADAFRQGLQSGLMLRKKIKMKQSQDSGDMDKGDWDPFKDGGVYNDLIKDILAKYKKPAVQEDAGEGHMSKSTLYHTAKYAIELMDMINKGDDLEGWVQTKLNLAADYLQAVYHYEDYQKLNPYREELDGSLIQKHAGIIQKHLDEILERKCRTEDVDTKPGMMRILKKRVNEVEKEIAKENRKESQETTEAIELEEGIREWGKRLAMAGVIVAGLAGVNSINNAIDNSVPAVKAMNTALELAQDSGNDELAKMIQKDLSDAKIRLSTGKDLGSVADLQDKYAKFMKTEGMAYESKLAVNLKQRLK